MSEEFKEHIFEPFSMEGRSREQGTGLGMPIVKNIVTMMAGDIAVESTKGQGTTFTVTFNLRIALEAERIVFDEGEGAEADDAQPLELDAASAAALRSLGARDRLARRVRSTAPSSRGCAFCWPKTTTSTPR